VHHPIDYAELNAKEQQSLAKIDTLQVDFEETKRLATKHAATSAQLRDVKVVSVERQLRMMAADKNATAVRSIILVRSHSARCQRKVRTLSG
jgi:hypothetical protein